MNRIQMPQDQNAGAVSPFETGAQDVAVAVGAGRALNRGTHRRHGALRMIHHPVDRGGIETRAFDGRPFRDTGSDLLRVEDILEMRHRES